MWWCSPPGAMVLLQPRHITQPRLPVGQCLAWRFTSASQCGHFSGNLGLGFVGGVGGVVDAIATIPLALLLLQISPALSALLLEVWR